MVRNSFGKMVLQLALKDKDFEMEKLLMQTIEAAYCDTVKRVFQSLVEGLVTAENSPATLQEVKQMFHRGLNFANHARNIALEEIRKEVSSG